MRMTIPTAITFLRIALTPLFVAAYYLPFSWSNLAATTIFALASFSDWADGYLARVLKQESAFGAFLDPVADKLMVVTAIVLLVQNHPSIYIALPSIIIIAREISVSALREWLASFGHQATLKVSFVAKTKTAVQLLSLLLMIYALPIQNIPIFEIGLSFYYLAAILTLASMLLYLRIAWSVIQRSN